MENTAEKIITNINAVVWGAPALALILGVGIYLTLQLDFVQLKAFPEALRLFLRQLLPGKNHKNGSSFQALCTALAATVGTGNLVGVAGAICLGGPGAVFWMWICGILGMVTKFTEALLAVRYRISTDHGYVGGPMYIITQALPAGLHVLAPVYALFGVIAAFGVGNAAQINAAVTGIREAFRFFRLEMTPGIRLLITVFLAGTIGSLLFGGAKRIGRAAERLIPFAAAGYILLCLGVLFLRWRQIPNAFQMIFQGAFSPRAVTGGMIGSAFQTLRIGCSRGVFTNEAGMGTASIAHAGAECVHPARQGLMGIMEVFLDTIVICTMTALVILVSGETVPYGTDAGGELTVAAFSSVYGGAAVVLLAAACVLFAVATVLGWSLYGARCAEFLFGSHAWPYFAALQVITVFAASFLETSFIWQLAEAVNGLMAIPNLITLALLAPEAGRLTKEYQKTGNLDAGGGNYADFHQCKPL